MLSRYIYQMVVYSLPISTLTMTLYLSYPMTTMEMMEPVPKMPPRQPYSRHAAARSVTYHVSQCCDEPTEGSPHPVSLGEGVDDDGDPHGGHHAQVGEREVHHEHVGGGPQTFHLIISIISLV